MVVATGAMLYCPFHQTVYYVPFLLLLLHNPAERIFFGGMEPTNSHTGPNKSRGRIHGAAGGDGDTKASLRSGIFNKHCNPGKTHMEIQSWSFTSEKVMV